MSLKSTLDAFGVGLAANLAAAGAEPCRFGVGEEHLHLGNEQMGSRQAKPSIVLVPIGAPNVEQWGSMRAPSSRVRPGDLSKPQELAVREEHVDAYVWTGSLDATEQLLNRFVATCRVQATAHAFKPLATKWALVDPDQHHLGTYCILRFWVRVPFTFEPSQIAKAPFTQSIDGELDVDGVAQTEVETA